MNDSNPISSQTSEVSFPKVSCKSFNIFAASIVAMMLCIPAQLNADIQSDLIREHASELECAAEEMKDEIKAHFKGTRMYGRLLGTNAQIKARAAAIERRVNRNPCYKLMGRDLRKLNELACELNSRFREALIIDARCEGRPIQGDTIHVADKFANLVEIVECMTAASKGEVVVGYVSSGTAPSLRPIEPIPYQPTPNYGSGFELYQPSIDLAPGVPHSVPQYNGRSVLSHQ